MVAAPDATRRAARETAREAATAGGRGPLLDESAAAARDIAVRSFARSGFSGTWAVTDMAVSVTRAEDRVAAAAAFEEAAMAAVVDDLVDEETADILRSTTDGLIDMTGTPTPGSLASFASPAAGAVRGPIEVGALIVFGIICIVIAAIVDLGIGLLVLAGGLALVAFVTRQRRQGQP
ncbi:MAG: hypothetical protein ACJ771_00475 [Chloroflexota bacterium]